MKEEQRTKIEALRKDENLEYLNRHHGFPLAGLPLSPSNERCGLLNRLKQKLVKYLLADTFNEYFRAQQDYNAHLVRFLNSLANTFDQNFWRDIREEQEASWHALERNIGKQISAAISGVNEDLGKLKAGCAEQDAAVSRIDGAVKGLESYLYQVLRSDVKSPTGKALEAAAADPEYFLFENRFRGSETEIRRRLEFYLPYLKQCPGAVLDIGCGRGELLSLCKEAGIKGLGVDTDAVMIDIAETKGLEVFCRTGNSFLQEQSSASLGGVVAIQVIEHLDLPVLKELLALAKAKIKPGGLVIFETINPISILALTHNYFRDPSHRSPLHPDTMRYLMELNGFVDVQIASLSPYPQAAQLSLIEEQPYYSPRLTALITTINENISRLNNLIFGYQDYALIARVAGKE
ncbi:MAG: class I SAM-dependent methyltransferase [Deltaproteobacteria bacterium]|nr:class I SAM-dependent methyltransferase [Deltaproteobacteria bacterium]